MKKSSTIAALILLFLSTMFACSHAPKKQESSAPTGVSSQEVTGIKPSEPKLDAPPPEAYGPSLPPGGIAPTPELVGPSPRIDPGIILVISPGVVRGVSSAGVLKFLSRSKIKISGIVATEMGAWLGALFAVHGNTNALEWQLNKAKRVGEKGWKLSDVNELVQGSLKEKKFSEAKIPLRVVIEKTQQNPILESGSITTAIQSALKGTIDKNISQRMTVVQLAEIARAQFPGMPIVVVRTLSDEGAVQGADLVIDPAVSKMDDYDFKNVPEAVFEGEVAVTKVREAVLKLSQGAHP